VLGILSSLLSNLPSDTPPRVRLLTKFVEQEYEKVDKLIEIREGAEGRLKAIDREIAQEKAVSSIVTPLVVSLHLSARV